MAVPLLLTLLVACGGDDDGGGSTIDASSGDATSGDGGGGADGGGGGGDGGASDASVPDALPPTMSIRDIEPDAASRLVDVDLTILGNLLEPGAVVTLTNCDDPSVIYVLADGTVSVDGQTLSVRLPADAERVQGLYSVLVSNPDGGSDELACVFSILAALPPTVTNVVPTSAFRGVPGDGVTSDTLVTITGTGFVATPNVRWISLDGTRHYDAQLVGFTSETELTALVPSETLHMLAGGYRVWVINPDQLSGVWTLPDTSLGTFVVTEVAPPRINDAQPPRVENGSCTSTVITLSGSGFDAAATAWTVVPDGTNCAGSMVDAAGHTLCPMTVVGTTAADSMQVQWASCPGTGVWPLAVINPDGQVGYFFSVQVTPSSDGHLNVGSFTATANSLVVPRWRHAANFGFDVFGNAYIYVAGGQAGDGSVLGSIELSHMSIFGTPGPFAIAQQYGDAATPRVTNALATPRQGLTLVRAGRDLFAIGGAATRTDTNVVGPAARTVERARILSYAEQPPLQIPLPQAGGSLPEGTWFYEVSAIGPWGEGLPSREVQARNVGGAIKICFSPAPTPGTTGYNVYRSLASDGRLGTTSLIASEVSGPCFTDSGEGALAPGPGQLRGNAAAGVGFVAGQQRYRVSAVTAAGETYAGYTAAITLSDTDLVAGNAAIQLAWNAVPGATEYRLYREVPAGFRLVATGPLTATEYLDAATPLSAGNEAPRAEVSPLAPGSLSRWAPVVDLIEAREGLDGVFVSLDPTESGGLIGRILVAGGRTSNETTATYHRSAESLGVHEDGTLDAEWFAEAPLFTSARAYFALLTTQGRDTTPFPPPPEEPPCADGDGDGYLDCTCAPPGDPADCDDTNDAIFPGAPEICGDEIDQDCDLPLVCGGTDLECDCDDDADLDGHAPLSCMGNDCCDLGTEDVLGCTPETAGGIHGGALEVCGNGIDENCDGIDPPCDCTDDLDGDGHVSIECGGDDCCDSGSDTSLGCTNGTAGGINPDMMERCENGIDEDCNGFDVICFAPPELPPTEVEPQSWTAAMRRLMSDVRVATATRVMPPLRAVMALADEPIYVLAVFGDDAFAVNNNTGRDDFEACGVDRVTGHLTCTQWQVQPDTDTKTTYGHDALLYFSFMFPFYGVNSETTTASPSRTFINSAIGRFPVLDLVTAVGEIILGNRQSASTSFLVKRSYYQMVRLMGYVYVVGGWADLAVDAPTATLEQHLQ